MKRTYRSLPFLSLNILTQMRKTYEGITELAESIAGTELIHAPSIACVTADIAEQYILIINHLYGAKHQLSELRTITCHTKTYYLIVIAGHRRIMALQHLYKHGCKSWRDLYPKLTPKQAFRQHFGVNSLKMSVYEGIIPQEMLDIQFAENTPQTVPIHEEAEALYELWNYRRQQDDSYTLQDLASSTGRSVENVSSKIQFFNLPDSVQAAVREGIILWGIGQALLQLQCCLQSNVTKFKKTEGVEAEQEKVDKVLEEWLAEAVLKKFTVKSFKEKVGKKIKDLHTRQRNIYELFELVVQEQHKKEEQIYGSIKPYALNVQASLGYLQKITWLIKRGMITTEHCAWLVKSVSPSLRMILECFEEIQIHHAFALSDDNASRILEVQNSSLADYAQQEESQALK